MSEEGVYIEPGAQPKERTIYVLLAVLIPLFSLCLCGAVPPVHNFYSNHQSKAFMQLGIWVGSWIVLNIMYWALGMVTFGVTSLIAMCLAPIVYICMFAWCIIDAVTVTKDASGVPMK